MKTQKLSYIMNEQLIMYQREKIVKIALKTLFLQMRMRSVSKLFECR